MSPIALIAAVARNGVIGRDNQLPWQLPGDLARFKALTLGKPIIMGRKTFDSLGRPLPGRHNIVVTRDPRWQHEGVAACQNCEQALQLAQDWAQANDASEIMIIGGGEIYRQLLPVATHLYLTEVAADIDGDAWFPELDRGAWSERARQDIASCARNPYPFSFVDYQRQG